MNRRAYVPKSHAPNLIPKGQQSADIAAQVEAFLAKGGAISQIEPGVSGTPREGGKGYTKQQRKDAAAKELRTTAYRRRINRGLQTTI